MVRRGLEWTGRIGWRQVGAGERVAFDGACWGGPDRPFRGAFSLTQPRWPLRSRSADRPSAGPVAFLSPSTLETRTSQRRVRDRSDARSRGSCAGWRVATRGTLASRCGGRARGGVGAEMLLLRWPHDRRGMALPGAMSTAKLLAVQRRRTATTATGTEFASRGHLTTAAVPVACPVRRDAAGTHGEQRHRSGFGPSQRVARSAALDGSSEPTD